MKVVLRRIGTEGLHDEVVCFPLPAEPEYTLTDQTISNRGLVHFCLIDRNSLRCQRLGF